MANQSLARYVNERRVLTMLRRHKTLSRAELARHLAITPAAISNMVENLIEEGLVIELQPGPAKKPSGNIGRPSVSLTLNPNGAFFLGVEVGVNIIRFALVNTALELEYSEVIDSEPNVHVSHVIGIVANHIGTLNRRSKFRGKIRAVGLTVPGLVTSAGHVVHLPILGWKDVNVLELARQKIRQPLLIENNANAAAFGEVYTQPNLKADCIVYLKPGMGCGGAVIVNGRLLRGTLGTGTELGHIRITSDGAVCSCGQRGCLETWVNLPALARAYDGSRKWTASDLMALPERLCVAEGNKVASEAIASVIGHLTTGLTSLINTFNPSVVVLGGAMRPVIEVGLPVMREALALQIVPGMTVPEIRLSTLGEMECAIGVAAIAHHQAFDISNIEVVGKTG